MAQLWAVTSAVGPTSNDDTASSMDAITIFLDTCITFCFLKVMLHSSQSTPLLTHSLLHVLHLLSKTLFIYHYINLGVPAKDQRLHLS
ncbi:hypothetical protein NXS19_013871 [Fusarium pseudograminearum]|nr:hypothetical protein NXS19_013871 [Fusarium pseudograminearum]